MFKDCLLAIRTFLHFYCYFEGFCASTIQLFYCVIQCGNIGNRANFYFNRIAVEINVKHKVEARKLSREGGQKGLNVIKRDDLFKLKSKCVMVCSGHFISHR